MLEKNGNGEIFEKNGKTPSTHLVSVLRRGIKGFDRNIKAKSCGTFQQDQHYQISD
jgi:hypothetical protein